MEITGRSLPPGEHLGDRLRSLRLRLGASLRETAGKTGISPNTLSAVERGDLGHLCVVEQIGNTLGAGLALVRQGEKMSFYASAGISSAHEAWATPTSLLNALCAALNENFDLDPCSPGKMRSRVPAVQHFTEADDGLAKEWRGKVFINPPYGRTIGAWVAKAHAEAAIGRATFVIGLVPARTDTRWWHADVAGHADVWLLKGRLAFGEGDAPAPFPSAVLLWGGSSTVATAVSGVFPDSQHIPARDLPLRDTARDAA